MISNLGETKTDPNVLGLIFNTVPIQINKDKISINAFI